MRSLKKNVNQTISNFNLTNITFSLTYNLFQFNPSFNSIRPVVEKRVPGMARVGPSNGTRATASMVFDANLVDHVAQTQGENKKCRPGEISSMIHMYIRFGCLVDLMGLS